MGIALTHLRAQWELEFPGMGATVATLRESLAVADSLAQEAQQAVIDFQELVEPLGEPMYSWPAAVLRFYNSLKCQYARDVRLRSSLLKQLRLTQPVAKVAGAVAQKETKKSPYSVDIAPNEGFFKQEVHVRVVDGKTVTTIDLGHDHWLGLENPLAICNSWIRHYWFENAHIPPEYTFVLEHEGLYYPPGRSIFIAYPAEEFLRLCQLEKDTESEHALDGERCNYQRLDNAKPIERPLYEHDYKDEEAIDPA